ncbi:MAG: YciI family protein [Rikenellaceae bacterium]|nr:YciI family protein [Rikenellaceae bacterium]
MFIGIIRYTRPIEEVDRVMEAHREYLNRFFESGHFLSCGRLVPRTGGIILSRADSQEEMVWIFREDPFCREAVAEYEVIEYQPTRWADEFGDF